MLAMLSRVLEYYAFVAQCLSEPIDEVGLFKRAAAASSRLTCECVLHLNPGQIKQPARHAPAAALLGRREPLFSPTVSVLHP